MKKSISYLLLFFCFLFVQQANATNPISIEAYKSVSIQKQDLEKTSFFSKVKERSQRFLNAALDPSKIRKLGLWSLLIGIASILAWGLVSIGGGWAFLLIAALAIAGDVLSIMTLWKTRKEKKDHRKARTMAWFGLILSLLTGLLPLLLFVIVLISL